MEDASRDAKCEPPPPGPASVPTVAVAKTDEDPIGREEALCLDKEQLEDVIHAHHVRAWNPDFCILICHKTAHRRLTMQLTFPKRYPLEKLYIELSSELLPKKLVERLLVMAEAEIDKQNLIGKPQVAAVYTFLDEVIHENKLLYSTPEIRKCAVLSNEEPKFAVIAKEKEGTVKVKATCGKFSLVATLEIPDEYPNEQVRVDIKKCSYPFEVWNTYLQQAREISRKCHLGIPGDEAVRQATTARGSQGFVKGSKEAEIKITSANLLGMKDDIKFLKQATDLRQVNEGYNKMLHRYDYNTQIRRAARRELKRRSKEEAAKEREIERLQVEAAERDQMAEWKRVMGLSEAGPQRSIYYIVEFLTRKFIFRLQSERSPVSGKPIFPADPAVLCELLAKRKKNRPVRVPTCGCWFIYSELEEFLTIPPFGKSCPRKECEGIVVQHPDWPDDIKKLEKAWAMKKAREREIAEVSDMFGLDSDFKV